jgi:hypothetical protein
VIAAARRALRGALQREKTRRGHPEPVAALP